MGWSNGSILAIDLWEEIRAFVSPTYRKRVALIVYDKVCDYDADDWDGTSRLEQDARVNQESEDYDWLDDELDREE